MGYVEAQFPNGNAVRIQNGDALKLGRLTYCDGCQSYEITEFGRAITDETGTLEVLWMCGKCLA
jgi:hypothetical protein